MTQKRPDTYTDINTNTQRTGLPSQSHKIVFLTSGAGYNAPATIVPVDVYDSAGADAAMDDDGTVASRMVDTALMVSQGVNVCVGVYPRELPLESQDDVIRCVPTPSEWSNPITWEMVNHPNPSGFIQVFFDAQSAPHFMVDLSTVNNVHEFFDAFVEVSHTVNIELRDNGDDSISIRYVSMDFLQNVDGGDKKDFVFEQRGDFYLNRPEFAGTASVDTICLSDAFDSVPILFMCV